MDALFVKVLFLIRGGIPFNFGKLAFYLIAKNAYVFWKRFAVPFPSLIHHMLEFEGCNLVDDNQVFTSFPIYIKPTYHMFKSFDVVGDQDENTQTKNALLDLATINLSFQLFTLLSTLG